MKTKIKRPLKLDEIAYFSTTFNQSHARCPLLCLLKDEWGWCNLLLQCENCMKGTTYTYYMRDIFL